MKGGDKTIPVYNVDANDPKIPNEQRELTRPKQPQGSQQPFITLQIATPPKQKPAVQPPLQYLPTMTQYPVYPQVPTQLTPLGTYAPPTNIVNQLVIGDQNPYQDHQYVHMIYEDVLPLKHLPNSLSTIGERMVLYDFIKSVILLGKDGENIPFKNGPNNLFDKIKATELNPYYLSDASIKQNPYLSLPTNFLIYRSCYPIRRADNSVSAITCAKDSIGMNIRIYRMTNGEMSINRTMGHFNDSEIWREIGYYEYVRENIIRTKQSPHFVSMIGYSMCNDSEIDFDAIEHIKGNQVIQQQKNVVNPKTNVVSVNPNAYGHGILIAITESPTYSLMQWASKTYANVGQSRRMINMGFHPDEVWFSIIFQIMVGMYAMQKHGLHINDFNLRDNIYVKDLSGMSNVTSYWKYVINGISYYVPNYGFLVMIDSKFKDVIQHNTLLGTQQNHKIVGRMFNNPSVIPDILDAFTNVIDMNNFGQSFVNNGGVKPTNKSAKVINDINKFAIASRHTMQNSDKIIEECIRQYMGRYINNRVGTILSKQEQDEINRTGKEFNDGDIIVYEENVGVYKFVLYLHTTANGVAIIMTRGTSDPDSAITMQAPIGNLYEYSKIQPIRQNYKPNEARLDESDLLETYNLDS